MEVFHTKFPVEMTPYKKVQEVIKTPQNIITKFATCFFFKFSLLSFFWVDIASKRNLDKMARKKK